VRSYGVIMPDSKTILVTGGAGFIGANFIRCVYAERPRWSIVNLDALTYAGNPGNLAEIADAADGRYQLIHGDICDVSLLDQLFSEFRFDAGKVRTGQASVEIHNGYFVEGSKKLSSLQWDMSRPKEVTVEYNMLGKNHHQEYLLL